MKSEKIKSRFRFIFVYGGFFLLKDKTIIVISHREDIVSICDSVAFLRKGTIHAIGTHQELLTYNPEYRTHFFKEQRVHA